MGAVVIDDLVQISFNNGIQLWDWTSFTPFIEMARWREIACIIAEHNDIDPVRLCAAVEKAIAYMRHDLLAEALCNGWPGGEFGPISFDRFMEIERHVELQRNARVAKRGFTLLRRREFQAVRAQLALRMLDAGVPYVCAHPDCSISADLTIDHKIALSRGGGDEIENLQFMCLPHNSQKSDS
jgi:hypothetical protein